MIEKRKILERGLIELYKLASTSLPDDILRALKKAHKKEKGNSKLFFGMILENIALANKFSLPICQDTGEPIFYVNYPAKYHKSELRSLINKATAEATKRFLRPNSVDPVTEKNVGNKPNIYFNEWSKDYLQIALMLKGAGSENVSRQYSLPDTSLGAYRDFGGVLKCALDAVFMAQGNGCPPGILGIGIGGNRESGLAAAKQQLCRKLTDSNKNKKLAYLERKIVSDANKLGIGPAGLGGNSTLLAAKITTLPRHPASYFVSVSYSCWALRRHSLRYSKGVIEFD